MFGNLFNNAVNAVKSFLGGNKAAVKPAPAPKANMVVPKINVRPVDTFQKFEPLVAYNPYIAKWGDSKATIQAGMAKNNVDYAAIQAQQKRQEEEKARAEAARRKYEAQLKFDKTRDEYAGKVRAIAKQNEENQKGNFGSWLTGGFAGENANRDFAQKQLEKLQTEQTARYDKKLNDFLKQQATKKAEIEKTKFKTQAEFDAAVGIFTKWEDEQIDDLEFTRAASTGLTEGWTRESQREGKSGIAKLGGWFGKNVVSPALENPIFKYTLGQGDENVPSLVTAPSRVVNWFGNATFNAGGEKNLHDNKKITGFEKGKNAWTQTFNQRNLNMPYAEKRTEAGFKEWYKTRDLSQWKADIDAGKIPKEKVEKMYKDMYFAQEKNDQGFNDMLEFVLDPSLGLGKVGKVTKPVSKWAKGASEAIKATEKGASFFNKVDKIATSKPVQWLNKEYKTPDQKFADAYQDAKKGTDALQQRLAPRIDAINAKLAGKDKIDTTILDDLGKLTDNEAAMLQRMVNGKFSFRDRLALRDIRGLQFNAPQREKLQDIAERWGVFAEKMKKADDIADDRTRFGFGKKDSFYSPRIDYTKDDALDTYNFAARKKINTRKNPQSAADLARNARERYILSNSGAVEAGEMAADRAKWAARRDVLSKEYETRASALRAGVRDADRQRGGISRYIKQRKQGVEPTTSLGRSVFNTTRNIAGLPMKTWKKSVLNYRPAWTVNNVGYNLQASALAGGGDALIESAKMLRPKNFKKAMAEVPDAVKADLTGELGAKYSGRNPFKRFDSKLNRGYSNVENFSRVAAFRGAKAKGLTDEQALKRVNDYMFDYKTKNWERPFKTVMPFWGWTKNLSKAAVKMPFDSPVAAKAYNEVDQYQNGQFDKEFEKTVPELLKLGYSEDEIQQIKAEQAKYYKGKLKVGDKWINTPFNAFSDRGLSGVGFNPYMTAVSESATSTDSFGRKIGGTDSLLRNRVLSKFPQYELGKKSVNAWRVAKGIDKPKQGWIGEKGSEGYGLSKERQGYDATAANYDRNLDPRAKLGQDALAFVGVPRSTEFDTGKLVESKRLQKATKAYFDLDTKGMEFDAAEKARQDVFKKYGITSDQFYKGVLSKYDTDNTKRIKGMKESAAADNKKLFDEYAKQPEGTRNVWATNKLRELNDRNYFADNPFKKSFSYITPETVAKADKQELVQKAVATGDWSAYRAKYGMSEKQKLYEAAKKTGNWSAWERKYGRTEKALARDAALKSGDWSEYAKTYGVSKKSTPYQFDGKFFKSADSMARYKEGLFWKDYMKADKIARRDLLAANPQFNRRANWTDEMWDEDKKTKKAALVAKARGWGDFAKTQDSIKATSIVSANRFIEKRKSKTIKTKWA